MRDISTLHTACDTVIDNPDLAPKRVDGVLVTHCNEGAEFVAERMGCTDLSGYMADEQYAIMLANESGLWTKVDGATATAHALAGGLAFAALPHDRLHEKHGHIAAVYPAEMRYSGSLGHDVPVVANVGVSDREEQESLAFPPADGEADYFTWS